MERIPNKLCNAIIYCAVFFEEYKNVLLPLKCCCSSISSFGCFFLIGWWRNYSVLLKAADWKGWNHSTTFARIRSKFSSKRHLVCSTSWHFDVLSCKFTTCKTIIESSPLLQKSFPVAANLFFWLEAKNKTYLIFIVPIVGWTFSDWLQSDFFLW